MSGQDEAGQRALATLVTLPPAEQLVSPLDYVLAEHIRQRALCWLLDYIASDEARTQNCVIAVTRFLRNDLNLHVADEEEDLFPLLRRRAEPDDRIDDVLRQLSREHTASACDTTTILAGLSRIDAEGCFSETFRALLHSFAAVEWRHLTVENAIVLPLARVRLTTDDLNVLGHRMAIRRSIDFTELRHAIRSA